MTNVRFDYYSGTVYLRRIMVEKGDKATTWAPAPEDEANARKLLIREVTSGSTQGIEVGYENGSYKAFINASGSFDVINAAGNTVARFGTVVTLDSLEDSSGNRMLTTFELFGDTLFSHAESVSLNNVRFIDSTKA